jgi:hypothetical protein
MEKTESIPTKVRNETRIPTFPILIQCSFGIPTQSNDIKAIDKREERSKTIPICR